MKRSWLRDGGWKLPRTSVARADHRPTNPMQCYAGVRAALCRVSSGAEMDEAAAGAVKAVSGAVAEAAKLGGKVVDAGTGFAGWLKDTFGTIPEDLLGIAGGDWLHHQRRRNLLALEARTEAIRQRIGAGPAHEPSVSVVLPLLQAAADESRPELQELWAALLASAMQPDGATRVRRAFFDTLRQMEPTDAKLFHETARTFGEGSIAFNGMSHVASAVGLEGAAANVAWDALFRLRLLRPINEGGPNVTPYGWEFWRACNP